METKLIKYVRDKNRNPIGVIVAFKDKIGWAKCNKKDKWNKRIGINIASGRTVSFEQFENKTNDINTMTFKVPYGFSKEIESMIVRAKKYFK